MFCKVLPEPEDAAVGSVRVLLHFMVMIPTAGIDDAANTDENAYA